MTQAIRTTIGIVLASATVIAISYMTTQGRENEREYLQNTEITSMRQEIKDKDNRIDALQNQTRQLSNDKKITEEALQKALAYINDNSKIDLSSVYLECIDEKTFKKPEDITEQDYIRFTTIVQNRMPAVRQFLAEKTSVTSRNYIMVTRVEGSIVNMTVQTATVDQIYPACKVTITPQQNYQYDSSKNTIITL